MTTVHLVIICVTVLALAGLAVFARVRLATAQPAVATGAVLIGEDTTIGKSVVVHKLDGQALSGTLVGRADGGAYVLSDVAILTGGSSRSAGGAWTVPAERVDCIQVL